MASFANKVSPKNYEVMYPIVSATTSFDELLHFYENSTTSAIKFEMEIEQRTIKEIKTLANMRKLKLYQHWSSRYWPGITNKEENRLFVNKSTMSNMLISLKVSPEFSISGLSKSYSHYSKVIKQHIHRILQKSCMQMHCSEISFLGGYASPNIIETNIYILYVNVHSGNTSAFYEIFARQPFDVISKI